MAASGRPPRRHTPRGLPPLAALGLATIFVVLASIVASPVANADPPPSWFGPWLELHPDHGRASDGFTATYWYVNEGCAYSLVSWHWDDTSLGTTAVDANTCSAKLTESAPPTTELGSHTVYATPCYVNPSDGSLSCNGDATANLTYVVDPTPTLDLAPATGLAAAPFKATYDTNTDGCGYTAALFLWDGTPIDPPVPMDTSTCSAVLDAPSAPSPNGAGKHVLSAEACEGSACNANLLATATYVVKPDPTPTSSPTPSPMPSPSPTPTPSPSPSPSPTPTPRPSPSPTPALSATPAASPSPSPTGEVLSETNVPSTPTPAPVPAVVVPSSAPSAGPPAGNPYIPALATFVSIPGTTPIDGAVVGTNLLLTLLVLFLFALTAEIFNSTMDAHRDEIHDRWTRLTRGPLRVVRPLTAPVSAVGRAAPSGRWSSILQAVIVLALLGLIYGFLSPDFGLNQQSVILFVSLVVGLGFMTYFAEGSSSYLAIRRYRAEASVRLFGTAILVAIIAVIVSRSVSFQPGLVYGFIASAVIVAPVALARRQDATLVLVPALGLLIVSILAWLLLAPVKAVADTDGSWLPALAETILAMIVIGGLEGLVVSMIPLTFMDGATVMGWNRLVWALTFGTVTFLWWQLLLNQNHAYGAAFEQTNVRVVLGTLAVFVVTTGGLWSYFRFRPEPREVEA